MVLDSAEWYWPNSHVSRTPHVPPNSTRSPIPYRPLFHTRLMMRSYDSCALSTSCTSTAPCVSTVRCPSEPAFLRFHDSLCFHRSLHLHDLLPHRVLAPSRLIAQYIAIASGQFYWAMHPMSSQQSLAIWVSHFSLRSARFPTSSSSTLPITFLETHLPQPSFRRKDTKKGYNAVLVRCTPVANTDSGTIEANRG